MKTARETNLGKQLSTLQHHFAHKNTEHHKRSAAATAHAQDKRSPVAPRSGPIWHVVAPIAPRSHAPPKPCDPHPPMPPSSCSSSLLAGPDPRPGPHHLSPILPPSKFKTLSPPRHPRLSVPRPFPFKTPRPRSVLSKTPTTPPVSIQESKTSPLPRPPGRSPGRAPEGGRKTERGERKSAGRLRGGDFRR